MLKSPACASRSSEGPISSAWLGPELRRYDSEPIPVGSSTLPSTLIQRWGTPTEPKTCEVASSFVDHVTVADARCVSAAIDVSVGGVRSGGGGGTTRK